MSHFEARTKSNAHEKTQKTNATTWDPVLTPLLSFSLFLTQSPTHVGEEEEEERKVSLLYETQSITVGLCV